MHRLLLFLHRIFLVGVFGIERIDFGLEHAHTGAGQIALLGGWINKGFHDDGQQQQYESHMETEALEPIEEIDDEPTVDPTNNRPAKIHEVF